MGKKETAVGHFSMFIRTRDALNTTGTLTHAKCITCGKIYPITEMDAGHAIAGRKNAILFVEEICFSQCITCNRHLHGNLKRYKEILIGMYGPEKWEEFEALKHKTVKYTDADFGEIGGIFREKLKELKKRD